MGLYLAGNGSYSFGYTDDDGNPQWQRVSPRQNVEDMNLPAGVVKQLKNLRSGRSSVFREIKHAPTREAGYTGGPISMDNYRGLAEKKEKADGDLARAYTEDPSDYESESANGPHVVVKPAGEDAAKQTGVETEVQPGYSPKNAGVQEADASSAKADADAAENENEDDKPKVKAKGKQSPKS